MTPERARGLAWFVAACAAVAALLLHLLPALLAGLLVFELVHVLAARFNRRTASPRSRLLAAGFIVGLVLVGTGAAIFGGVAYFHGGGGSLPVLFGKMAEILDNTRSSLPEGLRASLPVTADELRAAVTHWLRTHAPELQLAGKEAGLTVAHVIVGMLVGAMLAVGEVRGAGERKPLPGALAERARRLGEAFRRVVFAQVRISAINTLLTGLYLAVALPLLDIHLPLTKTMIALTFVLGLLPVIGNLASNVVIVVVSLAHSPAVAVGSLVFLVVVHKLEYFLNARIVGQQISARAWELLVAMLVMEAAFGIAGLVAAPIFSAWLKDELASAGLI